MKALQASHYLLEVALRRDKGTPRGEYPFNLPLVRHLRTLRLHPAVTFVIGENGSGKSTLLEAIATAWGFNPEGGSINLRFASRNSHSSLHAHLKLVRGIHRPKDGFFLRAESFFNVATQIEVLDRDAPADCPDPPVISHYGGRSLHEQSHGESFFALFMNRLKGHGLYIFDEPEAALSPLRQMASLARIDQLVRLRSQFIIATHSPILLAYPQARILQLTEAGLKPVAYTDTDYYRITREFLNRHEAMLAELLGSQDQEPPQT
jgi:predicted ATPase